MEQVATDTSITAYLAGKAKFSLGVICQSSGARDALARTGDSSMALIERHATGDWDNLDGMERLSNEHALQQGELRIVSQYELSDGTTISIITEADRSKTFVQLPGERIEP